MYIAKPFEKRCSFMVIIANQAIADALILAFPRIRIGRLISPKAPIQIDNAYQKCTILSLTAHLLQHS